MIGSETDSLRPLDSLLLQSIRETQMVQVCRGLGWGDIRIYVRGGRIVRAVISQSILPPVGGFPGGDDEDTAA